MSEGKFTFSKVIDNDVLQNVSLQNVKGIYDALEIKKTKLGFGITISYFVLLIIFGIIPFIFVSITIGGLNKIKTKTIYDLNISIIVFSTFLLFFTIIFLTLMIITFRFVPQIKSVPLVGTVYKLLIAFTIITFIVMITCSITVYYISPYLCDTIPDSTVKSIQITNAFNMILFGLITIASIFILVKTTNAVKYLGNITSYLPSLTSITGTNLPSLTGTNLPSLTGTNLPSLTGTNLPSLTAPDTKTAPAADVPDTKTQPSSVDTFVMPKLDIQAAPPAAVPDTKIKVEMPRKHKHRNRVKSIYMY